MMPARGALVVSPLTATITPVRELGDSFAASMYALYSRYYDATSPALFCRDLRDKDYVVLLADERQALRGFSTLALQTFTFGGRTQRAIFSGDTIVERAHWGQQALPYAWLRFAGQLKQRNDTVPLHWLLIVKGHRTYRYLPAFARRFYPNWLHSTPLGVQTLLDHMARLRFGDYYDAARGLIRFPASRGHLKADWAEISAADRQKPAVRFFLERNPGYRRGEELVCTTELGADNLRPLARRLFLQGLAK